MPVTDKSVMKSLNGTWDLKVVKGIDGKKEVPAKDKTWGPHSCSRQLGVVRLL
jgi:hypothetical protein